MKNEFLSYEMALALKELGFDEPCFTYYYNITNNIRTGLSIHIHNAWTYAGTKESETTLAPTFSQAFKFFREKYKLPSWIYTSDNEKFYYGILRDTRFLIDGNKPCETYEEAEWRCLLKLIEVVKNK
jgi:hypothetical protein